MLKRIISIILISSMMIGSLFTYVEARDIKLSTIMNAIIKNPIILKIFISSSFPSNIKLQKDEIEIEPIVANNTNIETGPYSTPIIQIIVVEVTDIASKIDNNNVKKSNEYFTSLIKNAKPETMIEYKKTNNNVDNILLPLYFSYFFLNIDSIATQKDESVKYKYPIIIQSCLNVSIFFKIKK